MSNRVKTTPEQFTEKEFSIQHSVEETIQSMLKDKEDNPDLIIPYSFLEFYNKPEMNELLLSVFEYCKCLSSINFKAAQLKEEGKNKEAKAYCEVQSIKLPDLGKKAAQKYGELLLKQRKLVKKLDDQNFYETIIYFLMKVIQPAFKREQFAILDEELNRLFRSTAFNITQRKLAEDEKFRKFPQLKKSSAKRDPDSVIKNILLRSWYNREKSKTPNTEMFNKPGYVKISPYKAITSRSPLISLLLPSPTDKIRVFEESRKNLANKNRKKYS